MRYGRLRRCGIATLGQPFERAIMRLTRMV